MVDGTEIRGLLVALLEAERAGVVVARKMLSQSDTGEETALLETILAGERDGCRTLGRVILDLGYTGSGEIGAFVGKVMALPDKESRMNLLIKGQEWVVRKLDELLEAELPSADRSALERIRSDHVVNIERCRKFLA